MIFKHPQDTKSILLGICASLLAVVIWDRYTRKDRKRFFSKKENE
tara:strand:+ start:5104 stop:5238 length:135 start_codon:yes stop_codon:yes gene_type:complete